MKLSITDIIDKEKGKTAYVVGMGPSLNENRKELKEAQERGDIIISCNFVDKVVTEIVPDYWVLANSEKRLTMPSNYARYDNNRSIMVWAKTVDKTPEEQPTAKLRKDHIPYSQQGIQVESIQNYFSKYTNSKPYGNGDTVSVHMLSLAVLLGCTTIYITGIDMDYSKGYADNSKIKPKPEAILYANEFRERIKKDFGIIVRGGRNIGVNMHSMSEKCILHKILEDNA